MGSVVEFCPLDKVNIVWYNEKRKMGLFVH